MKLSFFELNLLTMDDFVSYLEMWAPDTPSSGKRRATQADIDRYLG